MYDSITSFKGSIHSELFLCSSSSHEVSQGSKFSIMQFEIPLSCGEIIYKTSKQFFNDLFMYVLVLLSFLDCVHTMPAQFENSRKFDDKNSLQDLMPKNSTYILRIDLSRSKSVDKCSVFIFVECLNDAVSNLCRLRFRFQNLPFSKSAGKKCAVFV